MKLYIKNVQGLKIPSQANESDAGYDIVATTPPNIVGTKISRGDGLDLWSRIAYIEYGTNLFVAPQREAGSQPFNLLDSIDYHIEVFARSSISKYNLAMANSVGTIDNGYRAQILVRFKYLFQPEDFIVIPEAGGTRIYGIVNNEVIYQTGEKIGQIKARRDIPIKFEIIDALPESQRGLGGFGSSGK